MCVFAWYGRDSAQSVSVMIMVGPYYQRFTTTSRPNMKSSYDLTETWSISSKTASLM